MPQVRTGLEVIAPPGRERAGVLCETSVRCRSESIALRARMVELQIVQRSRLRDLRRLRMSAHHRLDAVRNLSGDLRSQCATPRPVVLRRQPDTGADSPLASAAGKLAELHTEYAANRDRRVRTQLLANYDTFAVALARRFPSRRDSAEDLAQVARVGLLHALDRFDPAMDARSRSTPGRRSWAS